MAFRYTDERELFAFHEDEIPYLSFRCLDETGFVRNAFTLRRSAAGVPVKLFWHPGEAEDEVRRFSAQLARQLGTDPDKRVSVQQKHTANVHVAGPADFGRCLPVSPVENTDALVTDQPGVMLCISVADCIPLMLADPVKKVIGLAHSGRKGTMQKIGRNTVRCMQERFGSDPKDILAAVGPGICASCYEVGDEIREEMEREWGKEKTEVLMKRRNGRDHLDLWKANKMVLLEAGLAEKNITVTNLCNRCNHAFFYSFRADGKIINQIAACLMLV